MTATTLNRLGPACQAAEIRHAFRHSKGQSRARYNSSHLSKTITFAQWLLAITAVGVAATGSLSQSIDSAVTIVIVISALSLFLAGFAIYHTLRSGLMGQVAMLGALWVMFFMETIQSILGNLPFSAPLYFRFGATQFDLEAIYRALLHLCVFQLMLLVGFAIPGNRYRVGRWLTNRVDNVRGRLTLQVLLLACIPLSLGSTYHWDWGYLSRSLLGSYGARFGQNSTLFTDQPFLAYLFPVGLYGAATLFVEALQTRGVRRYVVGAVATAGTLLIVLLGSRHYVLVILLPVSAVILRRSYKRLRISRVLLWASAIVLFFLISQAQVLTRDFGWETALTTDPNRLLDVTETSGQFRAFLFAESLVPARHTFFLDPTPVYFITQWIPRRLWPEKPEDKVYRYFNDEFFGTHPNLNLSNVTPSVLGQFYMNFGLTGVCAIGCFLGALCRITDNVFARLTLHKHQAVAVFVATFYMFIINSFRLFSPFYLMYSIAAFIGMALLTKQRRSGAIA